MTLSGSVFTTNASLPEADAVKVFVHMHIHTLSIKYKKCKNTHIHVIVPDMHTQTYKVGIAVMISVVLDVLCYKCMFSSVLSFFVFSSFSWLLVYWGVLGGGEWN
jgi:hypothetical protein